jgi:hypothetical protein
VRRAVPGLLLGAASLLSPLVSTRDARAEEIPVDPADGPAACKTLRERNERELATWQKQQPATPYVYPREDTVGNAPWGGLFKSLGASTELLLATIIPHVGAQLRAETPAAVVSWPWSFPIGPPSTCTRRQGTFNVALHRPHRAVLEPGIVSSNRGVGVFARPGYRYIHHPSDWVVGFGGGVGSTIEIAGQREPFRVGIGPELLAHFGHCCESSYFVLAVRYDRFFTGGVLNLLTATLGYTFF